MTILLEKLRALADTNRFRIVMMLLERPLCVCELLQVLDISGGTLSNHLRVLKQAGIVKQHKDGRWIIYEIYDDDIVKFLKSLEMSVNDNSLILKDRALIRHLTREICSSANAAKNRKFS